MNMTQEIEICFFKGRKHCGKRKNPGYQHFLQFGQSFQKGSYTGTFQVVIMWERVNSLPYNPDFQRPVKKAF